MRKIKMIIVEDKEEPGCAEVHVEAMIEGDEFDFLLDTGSGLSGIRNSEYTLNYPIVRNKESKSLFSNTQEQVIRIPSVRMGPIVKANVEFERVDNNPKANRIGMNILKDDAFYFDFKYNTIDVNPDDARYLRSCQTLFMDDKHHPYIDVDIDDVRLSAVFDTGAGISVVDERFVADHPAFFQKIAHSTGTDANGMTMDTPMYTLSDLIIDGYRFPAQPVAAVDLSHLNATLERKMDMIIGYRTFSIADWWFDFPAKKWKIVKFRG